LAVAGGSTMVEYSATSLFEASYAKTVVSPVSGTQAEYRSFAGSSAFSSAFFLCQTVHIVQTAVPITL